MTKLSICIPVEPGKKAPHYLCDRLLANRDAPIEIIVAPYGDVIDHDAAFRAKAEADPRIRILPNAPANISLAQFWIGTVAAMQGDWATLVRPDDMLEPGIEKLLIHVEETLPEVDACGWNSFTIDPAAPRHIATAVPMPVQHHVIEPEKLDMFQAFFQWQESSNVPRMPFGLYHCALKRELVDTILKRSGELAWLTPVPQYEWAARVLIFAKQFAFSSRPLSAISQEPYGHVQVPRVLSNFPFTAGIGLTAGIAEIQCRVLHEFNTAWDGFGDAFQRACMIDCMFEHDESVFEAKSKAYRAAFAEMGSERLAQTFQPPYHAQPREDRRRGLTGRVLMVDRFLNDARTAQEFYETTRYIMTPLDVALGLPVSPAVH
jgi:hypothetical protein